MELRDYLRFVGVIVCFFVIHELLFDLDNHDVTQGFVIAAVVTVVSAIRETAEAKSVAQ